MHHAASSAAPDPAAQHPISAPRRCTCDIQRGQPRNLRCISGLSWSGCPGREHRECSVPVLLDLDDDVRRICSSAHAVAEGPESVGGFEKAVDLPSGHDLVDRPPGHARVPKVREGTACRPPTRRSFAGPAFRLRTKCSNGLSGSFCPASTPCRTTTRRFRGDGESCQFNVGAELAAVLAFSRAGLQVGNLDPVVNDLVECSLPFLHAALGPLGGHADGVNSRSSPSEAPTLADPVTGQCLVDGVRLPSSSCSCRHARTSCEVSPETPSVFDRLLALLIGVRSTDRDFHWTEPMERHSHGSTSAIVPIAVPAAPVLAAPAAVRLGPRLPWRLHVDAASAQVS